MAYFCSNLKRGFCYVNERTLLFEGSHYFPFIGKHFQHPDRLEQESLCHHRFRNRSFQHQHMLVSQINENNK